VSGPRRLERYQLVLLWHPVPAAELDEAQRLAEADPAVVAGRLRVEAMTFLTAPDSLARPGIPLVLGE